MSTGIELFAHLSFDFQKTYGQIVSLILKTRSLSYTNLVASRHIKREESSRPIDVRHSKMWLLKYYCLRKCSRGQKLWSTDLAETWLRSWVWWDISKATSAHFSDLSDFFSFRVTGGGGGGLIFCPFSTKNRAFQGAFWKCHNSPLVNCAAKCIWPWTLL